MDASQMATIAMPRALPRNTHVNRQVAVPNHAGNPRPERSMRSLTPILAMPLVALQKRPWKACDRSKTSKSGLQLHAVVNELDPKVAVEELDGELIAKSDHGCLMMWLLPQQALQLASWLSEWEGEVYGNQETNFWRQRMILAMKTRLENLAFNEGPKDAEVQVVYSLHRSTRASSRPLAMAMVSSRSFNLEPLRALHLDHIVNSPEENSKGFGATLLQGLIQQAAMSQQVLVLEPQSPGLEVYFARLGFRHIQELDPYLWIFSGSEVSNEVSLRYVLLEDADHERLLAAFKRPPAWTGVTEEFYMASRQDTLSLDVLALFARGRGTFRCGFARRLRREKPSAQYQADDLEEVDLSEIMAVMRSPEKLEEVNWDCLEGFGQSRLPGSFFGVGRCSVSQKAFPLPGLLPSSGKVDLVIESLELQMRRDPVHSISITCTLGILAEVLEVTRDFFNTFRIRAAFYHNPLAWDLEVIQSDGLALASIESPPLPGEEQKRPEDLEIF